LDQATLTRYCQYHLFDIGELNPDNVELFKEQFNSFMGDVKDIDTDLYRDIMTLPISEQVNYLKSVYAMNSEESITMDNLLYECDSLQEELDTVLNSFDSDMSEISESTVGSIMDRIISSIFKVLNKIEDIWKHIPDNAKYVIIGAGSAAAILISMYLGLLTKIFHLLLHTTAGFLSLGPAGMGVIALIFVLMFTPFTQFRISGLDVIISKIRKVMALNFPITKRLKTINTIMTTDMKKCITSTLSSTTPEMVRNHVVYNLLLRDRSEPKTDASAIEADKILACVLSYSTNAIAELYGSLFNCMQIVGKQLISSASNLTSLQTTLSTMDMTPECQSINEAIIEYVELFEQILEEAFKNDSTSVQFWRDQLSKNIKLVAGGRHANPIKNAMRGIPKEYKNVILISLPDVKPNPNATAIINQAEQQDRKQNKPTSGRKAKQPLGISGLTAF